MPTVTKSSPERQARYRERLDETGRTSLQITTTKEAATKLRTLAAERDESPGRTLEHVLDVAAPAPLSARKHARLERLVDEALAVVQAGERHIGSGDARQRRRSARRLGTAS
ncbi:hypothetical protein [Bradyrhizobium sp. USDA 3364]